MFDKEIHGTGPEREPLVEVASGFDAGGELAVLEVICNGVHVVGPVDLGADFGFEQGLCEF